jgi:hypothetical protein
LFRDPKKQTPSSTVITNRTILFFVFLLFAFVAGLINGCYFGKGRNVATPCDTITRTDTVYIPSPKDSTPLHLPQLAETKKPSLSPYKSVLPPIRDTQALSVRWVSADAYAYLLSLYKAVEAERDSLWEKYYSANYYRDTANLSGGILTFSGVSQENKIQSVQYGYTPPPIPVITKVVTLREPERNKAYAGVYTSYRPYDASAAVGATFLFVQKRGLGLQLHGGFNTRGEGEYGLGVNYELKRKR